MNLEQGWPLVAILLTACATGGSAPTQYGQGVPVAPRAPMFNPITDAPITTGQPGYAGPAQQYPRSPYGRVLPETPETRKEPGIWASRAPDHDGLMFLGVVLPLPDNPSEDEKQIARDCTNMGRMAIGQTLNFDEPKQLSQYFARLSQKDLTCIAARVYLSCVGRVILNQEIKKAKGESGDPKADQELARLRKVAERFEDRSCRISLSKDASTLTKGVSEWFRRGIGQEVH